MRSDASEGEVYDYGFRNSQGGNHDQTISTTEMLRLKLLATDSHLTK